MATSNRDLTEVLNDAFQLIEKIKSTSFGDASDLKPRLDKAKFHLDSSLVGMGVRECSKRLLRELEKMDEGTTPDQVQYYDSMLPFDEIRFNFMNAYLSSTWGVYDNINHAIKLIHGLDMSSGGEFITVLENERTVDNDKRIELLKEFKFVFHFFYQIRNAFVHGASSVYSGNCGFISNQLANRFIARKEMFEFFCRVAVEKKYLTEPAATNKAKELGLTSDRCLWEVCNELEGKVDELASKFLILSLRQKALAAEN